MKDIGGQGLENYIHKYAYLCGTNRRFDPFYDISECKDDIKGYVFESYQKLVNLESEILEDEKRLYNYLKRVVWTRASKIKSKVKYRKDLLHLTIANVRRSGSTSCEADYFVSDIEDNTNTFASKIVELPQLNYTELESLIVNFLSKNPSEPRLYTKEGKLDVAYIARQIKKPYTSVFRAYNGLIEKWQQKIRL